MAQGGGGFGGGSSLSSDAAVAGSTGLAGREGQGGALGVAGSAAQNGAGGGVDALDAGVTVDAGAADSGALDPGADASAPPACIPSVEVCDGLDNDCDGVADRDSTCIAECEGFALEGRGYMFCAASASRAEALGRCELEGMHLAWLESAEEEAALLQAITSTSVQLPAGNPELLTQIGASDAANEGEWFWVGTPNILDGFQFWEGGPAGEGGGAVGGAYANWDDIEPNDQNGEDCGVISVRGGTTREPGQWDDRSCALSLPFVCEAE